MPKDADAGDRRLVVEVRYEPGPDSEDRLRAAIELLLSPQDEEADALRNERP